MKFKFYNIGCAWHDNRDRHASKRICVSYWLLRFFYFFVSSFFTFKFLFSSICRRELLLVQSSHGKFLEVSSYALFFIVTCFYSKLGSNKAHP